MQSPAAARNREPILAVLRDVLPAHGDVLEVASGSGEHVVHFAAALPHLRFVPSDADPDARHSIAAWVEYFGLDNVVAPLALDVLSSTWPLARADAIFCANMIHIAPWEATLGLLAGAGRTLSCGGVLVLYGPYRVGGRHTAVSNERFDASLRARDPRWGVRDLEAVIEVATTHGLAHETTFPMPANNLTLVFRRTALPGEAAMPSAGR